MKNSTFPKAKKFLSILLTFAMLLSTLASVAVVPASAADVAVWDGTTVASAFAGGSGTADDPYQISNGAELAYLATLNAPTSHYKLTADIYLNDVSDGWTEGSPNSWVGTLKFAGTFDGDGHTIYGLYINDSSAGYVGLFQRLQAYAGEVAVKNVTISDSYIVNTSTASDASAGAFAGYTYGNTNCKGNYIFENCYVTDSVTVSASGYAGGFAGLAQTNATYAIQITNSASLATVSDAAQKGSFIGGRLNYIALTLNVTNSFAVVNEFYGGTSAATENYVNSYEAVALADITGSKAKETMPNLAWDTVWAVTEDGYPIFSSGIEIPENVWTGATDSALSGSGTYADPYKISTAEQLAYLVSTATDTSGKYYVLTADIDLNYILNGNFVTYNNWYSSAQVAAGFAGTFDGQGYTISGLYYNGSSDVSLFPKANGAVIKNVNLTNASITTTATSAAGFVVNPAGAVTFIGCYVDETVSISGVDTAGYYTYGSGNVTVESCFSAPTLSGTGKVGAFIGDTWGGTRSFTNSIAVGYPLQYKTYGTIYVTDCYGTVSENATVSGNHTVLESAELMIGTAAETNMPNLDWQVWKATDSYPALTDFFINGINGTVGEVWSGYTADAYESGSGTSADPYVIKTAEQLARMLTLDGAAGYYFSIEEDIYLNDVKAEGWTENSPNEWYDSNDVSTAFVGTINGNGNNVYGLYYNGTANYFGLLPIASNTTVENLIISEAVITSSGNAAAFIGHAQNTITIKSCVVDETVSVKSTGASASGYMAYGAPTANIKSCVFTGALEATGKIGAFMADVWSGTRNVTNSFAVGYQFAGNHAANAVNCYNTVSETKVGDNIPVVLEGADQMTGESALENMPNLTGYAVTESYPSVFYNGAEGAVWSGAMAYDFADGTGTEANPYAIRTAEQLARLLKTETNGKYYVIEADIILSDENTANNWLDSSNTKAFKGNLDGQNYIVSGLNYSKTVEASEYSKYAGVIPMASGAVISNIVLADSAIAITSNTTSATYAGGILGFATGETEINGCYVAEDVTLSNKVADGIETIKTVVGGIVGGGQASVVVDGCAFFGTLEYSEYRYGAVMGDVWTGTRTIKNTVAASYTPSSYWSFVGSNNVTDTAVTDGKDTDSSFTVVESLRDEAGLAAIESLNTDGKYYGTKTYPTLSALGLRLSDVNGDRESNALDLTMMRQNLLKATTLGYTDINDDGAGDLKDLVALKKKSLELDNKSTYELVWSDEFDGTSLDETKWSTQTRMADTTELAQSDAGYVRSVSDGNLQLSAIENPYYNADSESYFEQHKYATSTSVTTENKMSFKYGYLEIKAKVPYKEGCWPSFWLRSHHATGKTTSANFEVEVDVFEVFGSKASMASNLHQQDLNGKSYQTTASDISGEEVYTFENAEDLSNEYHTYAFEWTPEKMAVYVDGVLQCEWYLDEESLEAYGLQADGSGFDTTLNILFNNHLFTESTTQYSAGDNIIENYKDNLPAEYDIEYVRLYQKNDGLSRLILGE